MCLLEDLINDLEKTSYKTSEGQNTFVNWLEKLANLTGISKESIADLDLANRAFLKIIELYSKHLQATSATWCHSENNTELHFIAKQLVSIAVISGKKNEIETIFSKYTLLKDFLTPNLKAILDSTDKKNFLNDSRKLKFIHFNQNLLAIELMLRVLEPKRVLQAEEQVCGVVGFIQSIILTDPLTYTSLASNLAFEGQANIRLRSDSAQNLTIKIKEKSIFAKQARENSDEIPNIDHIVLNGIRSSENSGLITYSINAGFIKKSLFGVTTPKEAQTWMTKAGFEPVHLLKIQKAEHIKQLELLINDGYTVGFCTTSQATNFMFGHSKNDNPNKLKQLLNGHFIIIKSIRYFESEEGKTKVALSIISWGEEVIDTEMDYKTFIKINGLATAIIGLSAFNASNLRAKNRAQIGYLYSPIAFCLQIQGLLKTNTSSAIKLKGIIEEAKLHKNGLSWFHYAKILQDQIKKLLETPVAEDIKLLSSYQTAKIIPGSLDEQYSKLEKAKHLSPSQQINHLEHPHFVGNVEALCRLIPLYLQEKEWLKLVNIFTHQQWQNACDKNILELEFKKEFERFVTMLKDKIILAELSAELLSKIKEKIGQPTFVFLNQLVQEKSEKLIAEEQNPMLETPATVSQENIIISIEEEKITKESNSILPFIFWASNLIALTLAIVSFVIAMVLVINLATFILAPTILALTISFFITTAMVSNEPESNSKTGMSLVKSNPPLVERDLEKKENSLNSKGYRFFEKENINLSEKTPPFFPLKL
ncbi:MAG: hypothetical protein LCH30_06895 [Proteobacteria bacterium]|nr:hypothetical protein [Pseudomonadota bacterium]